MPKRHAPHTALFTPDEQDALAGLILSCSLEDFSRNGPCSRVLSLEIHGVHHHGVLALLVVQPMDAMGEKLHRHLQGVCETACAEATPEVEPTRSETTRWLG